MWINSYISVGSRISAFLQKDQKKNLSSGASKTMFKGIFGMSSKFHCCSKHTSKRQTPQMRFVQCSGEMPNASVTSPLTAEWLFQSRPACNQWQKVTHTPQTRAFMDELILNASMHTHVSRLVCIGCAHIHSDAKQIQNKHMSAYTETGIHWWINTLGHNPRDEPYGTSIGSSITQSQKMAGSLWLCVSVWVWDKVS